MIQFTKRLSAFFLCLCLFISSFSGTASADIYWPSDVSVQAEGAIVMDGNTGTVLWGQNIHSQYFPASITKIMTALLTIENCSLDETVTFSHSAVSSLEDNSSSAGIREGETMSVRDCLYALLLKSANEAANALAEHAAGDVAGFADMMNDRAQKLGCTNTHFSNPSGLNDPEHYTSAYDMALIAREAFKNPIFREIDSTTYYKLPPTAANPEGLETSPKHQMLRRNSPYYYPGVVGGKTGYTSLAGNTLVTCAEKGGMRLITVILKGTTPRYWTDTKNLLNFGFDNFFSLKAADYEKTYSSVTDDLSFGGLFVNKPEALVLDPDSRIILPKAADFSDASPELSYDISSGDPENAVAKINYRYDDRVVGCTFLEVNEELANISAENSAAEREAAKSPDAGMQESSSAETSESSASADEGTLEASASAGAGTAETSAPGTSGASSETEDYREKALRPFEIPLTAWLILGGTGVLAVIAVLVSWLIYRKRREDKFPFLRREKRRKQHRKFH